VTDRRNFFARVVAGATALSGAPGLAEHLAALESAPASQRKWDNSWTERVTGKYRAVFDVPEMAEGVGVFRANLWYANYEEMYGAPAEDLTPVIVIRHAGVPMLMNDDFWAQYGYREQFKDKLGEMAGKGAGNPFLTTPFMGKDYGLTGLISRNCVILGCGLAFGGRIVSDVMKKDNLSRQDADAKARSFLLPGVALQPSGIFAVARAQDLGCSYVWGV
jgi:hypothetical protein